MGGEGREGGQVRRGLLFEQMEQDDPRGKEAPPSVGRDIEGVVRKGRNLFLSNSSSLPSSFSSFSSSPFLAVPVGTRMGEEKKEGGDGRRLRRKIKV